MKTSLIKALKSLHKLESGANADGKTVDAADADPSGRVLQHVPPHFRSERKSDLLNAGLSNPTSLATVGLSSPHKTECEGFTFEDTARFSAAPDATHFVVDALTPWQASTYDADGLTGTCAVDGLAQPSHGTANGPNLGAKPAALDSQVLQDGGRRQSHSHFANQPTFEPRIRPIPAYVDESSDVPSDSKGNREEIDVVPDEELIFEDGTSQRDVTEVEMTNPKRRQPGCAIDQRAPSPTAPPLATAFEEEVRERFRQSTYLSQFQDLGGRFTKGFSHDTASSIAVAHLDEMQHTLQVIASVARVLGTNRDINTLLVDTDTNHKTLSKCFDVDCHEGFGEACGRIQLWPHLVRPTATRGVSILPAGNFIEPMGPDCDRIRQLFSALSGDDYSVVLINAGDILNPLTKQVCEAADSAHLLMRLGKTERARTAQVIHTSGIRFQGIIVTNVP